MSPAAAAAEGRNFGASCETRIFAAWLRAEHYRVGKLRVTPPTPVYLGDGGARTEIIAPVVYRGRSFAWHVNGVWIRAGRIIVVWSTTALASMARYNNLVAPRLALIAFTQQAVRSLAAHIPPLPPKYGFGY